MKSPPNDNTILLWLSLNRYSLMLFAGALSSVTLAILALAIPGWWLATVAFGLLSLVLVSNGMKIHQQSGHKHRAVLLLTVRNSKRYSPEGFRKYMVSPCGRVVVRTVLSRLGRKNEYRSLKRTWPMKFCESPAPAYSVTFHGPAEPSAGLPGMDTAEPASSLRD